jgi:hypothetical protein
VLRSIAVVLSCLVAGLGVGAPAAAAADGATFERFAVVAGTGEQGYSGDGHRATDARISDRGTIGVAPNGTLYIADAWSKRVRAVGEDGVIDTVPGTRALRSPATDGPEVDGWQYSPSDRPVAVAVGPDGTLYVAGSETVRRVAPDGSSAAVVALTATGLRDVTDIAVSGGNVYLAGEGHVIRIDPSGAATAIAGGGELDPAEADGKPATQARLRGYNVRMAVDAHGTVYVVAPADSQSGRPNATLHRVGPDGTLHTVAGGLPGFSGDGGPAAEAGTGANLGAVAVDPDGNVYFHDVDNGLIRVVDTRGVLRSIPARVPPSESAGLFGTSMTFGPDGALYVKTGAKVFKLVREKAKAPHRPDYPARFSGDEPGAVHTVAGNGSDEDDQELIPGVGNEPRLKIAVGPDGTSYYSDLQRNRVMKVATDGTVSVLAGTGEAGFSNDGREAETAALKAPSGVAVGPDGSVYIADAGNYRLRKVDPAGVITTVAGNGQRGEPGGLFGEEVAVHGDGGPALAATVAPSDVAVGGDGSLYLAEGENKRISRIAPDGTISTVAGGGERWKEAADGHPAVESDLFRPSAVAVGPQGQVYFVDNEVETIAPAVRMVDTAGILRTVAGNSYRDESESGFAGDGGPGTKAEINNPHDVAVGADGVLYIADTYNARVRAVSPDGTITTFAGTGEPADSGDKGPAGKAAVNEPQSVAVDVEGALHVLTSPGDRIRVVADGTITTTARLTEPEERLHVRATEHAIQATDIAVDGDGNVLIGHAGDTMYKVDATGMLGEAFTSLPQVSRGQDIATGLDGSVYVASGNAVYRMNGDEPLLVAGGGPAAAGKDRVGRDQPAELATFGQVTDLTVSPAGRLYVATNTAVYRLADGELTMAYRATGPAELGSSRISGIAVDAQEQLYVADAEEDHVYRVAPDGTRTTFAGADENTDAPDGNGDGEDAEDVSLGIPTDVVADGTGNVYIATYSGIRRVGPDGTITTVVGNPPDKDGSRGATGPLALDRHGNLYFADRKNNLIKVLVRPGELSNPVNWSLIIWLTAGALAATAAAWFVWRRHHNQKATPPEAPAAPSPTRQPLAEPTKEEPSNPTAKKPTADEPTTPPAPNGNPPTESEAPTES